MESNEYAKLRRFNQIAGALTLAYTCWLVTDVYRSGLWTSWDSYYTWSTVMFCSVGVSFILNSIDKKWAKWGRCAILLPCFLAVIFLFRALETQKAIFAEQQNQRKLITDN